MQSLSIITPVSSACRTIAEIRMQFCAELPEITNGQVDHLIIHGSYALSAQSVGAHFARFRSKRRSNKVRKDHEFMQFDCTALLLAGEGVARLLASVVPARRSLCENVKNSPPSVTTSRIPRNLSCELFPGILRLNDRPLTPLSDIPETKSVLE